MNAKLSSLLNETGEMLKLGKSEISMAVKSRKNIVIASLFAFFAIVILQNIASNGTRYAGSSINDFIQMGRFL